jgi:hypothetical protein
LFSKNRYFGVGVSLLRFQFDRSISDELLGLLEHANPVDCYCTKAYRDAVVSSGREAFALSIFSNSELLYGCLAEYSQGRLSRGLHIQSTPSLACQVFWDGLRAVCKKLKITHLSLGTLGSCPNIPSLGFVLNERSREEYWVDLTVENLEALLRKQQRVVYKRAVSAGMSMRQVSGADAMRRHKAFTDNSLGRRRARGESIPFFESNDFSSALIKSGAGQMFEALLGDTVLGSVIVTVSKSGAHGYSAGYSKEGMTSGASVFLYLSSYIYLKDNGKTVFNLGDAPPDSGLASFKKGLGGVPHSSITKEFHMAGALHRNLLSLKSKVSNFLRT